MGSFAALPLLGEDLGESNDEIARLCLLAPVSPTILCSSQPYFTGMSAPGSAFSTKRMGSLGLGLRSNRPLDGLRAMSTLAGGSDGSMKVLYDGKCPICLFEIKVLPPPFPSLVATSL
jgi:hypothetical protein